MQTFTYCGGWVDGRGCRSGLVVVLSVSFVGTLMERVLVRLKRTRDSEGIWTCSPRVMVLAPAPKPPPLAAPIAAPLPPPRMPPRMAPTAAPPPTLAAVFLPRPLPCTL